MSYLVRKINKSKWFQIDISSDSDASGDAITNCLRTNKNTLSFWKIKDKRNIESVILALTASADHLETIDIVVLENKEIEEQIDVVPTTGNSPYEPMNSAHRDLTDITYSKLGIIKDCIIKAIRKDLLKRFTRSKLKSILIKAIENGKLNPEDLKDSVRSKVI